MGFDSSLDKRLMDGLDVVGPQRPEIANKVASVAILPYYFLPSAYITARSLCFGRLALAGAYALRVPPQVKHLGLFTPVLPADKGEDQFGFLD